MKKFLGVGKQMLNIHKNYSKKLTLLKKIFKLQCFMLKNL